LRPVHVKDVRDISQIVEALVYVETQQKIGNVVISVADGIDEGREHGRSRVDISGRWRLAMLAVGSITSIPDRPERER